MIIYGPSGNQTRVPIGPIVTLDNNQQSSSEGEGKTSKVEKDKQPMEDVLAGNMKHYVDLELLECLGPNLYHWKDDGE